MEINNKKLLVCISFHNVPEKLEYLLKVINTFKSYPLYTDIIVDTNSYIDLKNVILSVHNNLNHPWDLTWMHRKHIKEKINDYDYFIYVEDDMQIPYENFKNYIDDFSNLWSKGYIPSFVRVEMFNNIEYVVDVTEKQCFSNIIKIEDKEYIQLSQPYHAFWILPKEELQKTMKQDFLTVGATREEAAWYPAKRLNKKQLVLIDDKQVSHLCYSYHLSNNYSSFKGTPFGKIEINKIINQQC